MLDKHLTTEPQCHTPVHWRRGLAVVSTPKHWVYRCVPPLAEISNPQVPWIELLVFYLLLGLLSQALLGVFGSVFVGSAVCSFLVISD